MTAQQLDKLNEELSRMVIESGHAMLTTTILKGKVVLRMCLVNPRIAFERDIEPTIRVLEEFAMQSNELQ